LATQKKAFSYCLNHEKQLPVTKFYPSKNPNHHGYMPFCKDCCTKVYQRHYEEFKDLESAIWFTCADVGIPFIKSAYGTVKRKVSGEQVKRENAFDAYVSALKNSKAADAGTWKEFSDTDAPFGDIRTAVDLGEERQEEIEKLRLAWGEDATVDDLGFLEWRFLTYTSGIETTEYQVSRYRDLCMCELRIKKNIDTQTNMKLKASIAKELGIDKFEIEREKTEVEKYIENDIYMMEKYEPAEYYKDKELYKDFLGIHKYWIDWVLRPVRNLVVGSKDYDVDVNSKYGDK
jgi:hypothetical protein